LTHSFYLKENENEWEQEECKQDSLDQLTHSFDLKENENEWEQEECKQENDRYSTDGGNQTRQT
jgi:hypothetical protein